MDTQTEQILQTDNAEEAQIDPNDSSANEIQIPPQETQNQEAEYDLDGNLINPSNQHQENVVDTKNQNLADSSESTE